ncbi:MAG: MaoC/PaaZ C-terminal domain-containing protein [Desulfobulbaceae bacterium]|nr:MaoC/PaaZ C-terminal domain-containing protein [Desulfobulbaceae bacterium]
MSVATKEMIVGQELPALRKVVTLEHMRLYTLWSVRNTHTDWEWAKKSGVPAPICQGLMIHAYVSEMCTKFFGENWFKGGKLDVRFASYTLPGDVIEIKGVVREKIAAGDAFRFNCDIWVENQAGEKTLIGSASALVA